MTAGDALLRAIIESPEDDVPRLVYADWLDEHGQVARGEFIRLQCELEHLPPEAPRRHEIADRCDDLLAEHEEAWLGSPPACLERWRFRRGFVESLTLQEETSLERCAELFGRHPIRSVHLSARGEAALRLGPSPWQERLEDLYLTVTDDVEEFVAGARGRADLAAVTGLCDFDCGVIPDGLVLREMPFAPALRRLELGAWGDQAEGLAGLRPLLAGGAFPQLTALYVQWWTRATLEELAPLLESPRADRWRELQLLGPVTSEGLNLLSRCPRLERIGLRWDEETKPNTPLELPSSLTDLSVADRTAAGTLLPALARSSGLERLRSLHLLFGGINNPSHLSPSDLQALGEVLARLRGPVLHLALCGCPEGTLRNLAELESLDRLASLSIQEHAVVKEAELSPLVERSLPGLRCLELPLGEVSTAGIRLLAGASWLAGLRQLSLIEGAVFQEGLEALLHSPHLRRLTHVDLFRLHGKHSAAMLANWPGLRRLRVMDVRFRDVSAAEVRPFLQSAHLGPLLRLDLSVWFGKEAEHLGEEELQALRARLGCRLKLSGDLYQQQ
jgi:uncharacterized protein (TIGR02996 family)